MRKLLMVLACAITVAAVSVTSAFAGEITGSGKPTAGPAHAASECVFSGFNDNPNEAFPFGGTAQSYGRLVAQLGPTATQAMFPSPGVACNPS
jgi:hypothetical protein